MCNFSNKAVHNLDWRGPRCTCINVYHCVLSDCCSCFICCSWFTSGCHIMNYHLLWVIPRCLLLPATIFLLLYIYNHRWIRTFRDWDENIYIDIYLRMSLPLGIYLQLVLLIKQPKYIHNLTIFLVFSIQLEEKTPSHQSLHQLKTCARIYHLEKHS